MDDVNRGSVKGVGGLCVVVDKRGRTIDECGVWGVGCGVCSGCCKELMGRPLSADQA